MGNVVDLRYDEKVMVEIQSMIHRYAMGKKHEISIYMDTDDFEGEVMVNLYARRGIDAYDSDRSNNLYSVIKTSCDRYLTDVKRSYFARRRHATMTSLDEPRSNESEEECSLMDLIGADASENLLLMELLNAISNEIIPSMGISWRVLAEEVMRSDEETVATTREVPLSRVQTYMRKVKEQILEA